jgi:hypothetical protein
MRGISTSSVSTSGLCCRIRSRATNGSAATTDHFEVGLRPQSVGEHLSDDRRVVDDQDLGAASSERHD